MVAVGGINSGDALEPRQRGWWTRFTARILAGTGTAGGAVAAATGPGVPAGELVAELVKGAIGGCLVGLWIIALKGAGKP